MQNKIIAVDFDGTLCENAWPGIGAPKQAVIKYILSQQKNGAKLILWTNRTGERLREAVSWCNDLGIEFDAVNENTPEIIASFGDDCRKVFANEYIDDRAIPLPGETLTITELVRAAHNNAILHGFWDDPPEFGTSIALIHSELSEALEEIRVDNPPRYYPCNAGGVCCEERDWGVSCGSRVWNPETPDIYCKAKSNKPEGWAVELADAVIRIADLCGHECIDLETIIREKMEYNATRPYKHGKIF